MLRLLSGVQILQHQIDLVLSSVIEGNANTIDSSINKDCGVTFIFIVHGERCTTILSPVYQRETLPPQFSQEIPQISMICPSSVPSPPFVS